jgi:hypothetical protein
MPERSPEIFHSLDDKPELTKPEFSETEQRLLDYRQHILSGIAQFIGRDFTMPVEYGEPGDGWHWNTQTNRVQADPAEVLSRELDESRFIIAHEGSHRRISRLEMCDRELLREPGFMFLLNAIEDPRVNNFLTEAYPRFLECRNLAYQRDADIENRAKEHADGQIPRFVQAGFAFIKAWYGEESDQVYDMSELSPEVREVVERTLESAREAWLTYPSKVQADADEKLIDRYMLASYEIIRDKVWPEFQKLIEQDLQDQALSQLQQQLQSPQEGQEGSPDRSSTPPGELSDEQKQALQAAFDQLPEDQKQALREAAKAAIAEIEAQINQSLGEFDQADKVDQLLSADQSEQDESVPQEPAETPETSKVRPYDSEYAKSLERLTSSYGSEYEQVMAEMAPLIDQLESRLREIFHARRTHGWQNGYRRGKRINVRRRMQETAQGVSAVESQAWQRRELPTEKDYAISLLIDLSGSMRGEKISQTFQAMVVVAEALNRLGINFEISGFHDEMRQYKTFSESLNQELRSQADSMLEEVESENAQWNDDGWALQQAGRSLSRQTEAEKFLLVFSDGQPVESSAHSGTEYDLTQVIEGLRTELPIKLVGLGIGLGTEHVDDYYPNSVANISIEQMVARLSDLIEDMIENPDQY